MHAIKRHIAALAALAAVSVAVVAPATSAAGSRGNRAKLRAVLLYHVIKGRITATKLVKLHSAKTLNGQSLTVRVKNGAVTIGGVRVIKTNIAASNGVIRVINSVLIPR